MKESNLRSAPPIPPRRLKRKNKTLADPSNGVTESATSSALRSERRPRLPPPPPPQRGPPPRQKNRELPPPEIAPRNSADNRQSRCPIADDKEDSSDVEVRPPLSTFGTTFRLPLVRGCSPEKKPVQEAPRRRVKDKTKVTRPNEYPPLFFTLQDFQEVMADVESSYCNRTLRNMTSFEPTPKPRKPEPDMGEVSINHLPETPKGQVLFRVTTTNVPFEKCPSGWSDCGNDPNHFIFEDYVDRRQMPPAPREPPSTKLVLFGDDTFDREDDDQTATSTRTCSKVRFLVDSPSEEAPDQIISEFDSLQNIESLPSDEFDVVCTHAKDTELEKITTDEFGDVPFYSLLNVVNDSASFLSPNPSEDSTSSKTDFQTILVKATVEKIPESEKIRASEEPSDVTSNVEPVTEKRDQKLKEEESSRDEKNETEDLLNDLTEESSDDKKSPIQNGKRNSFLMNMLEVEKPEEKVICKVVATHPKTPIRRCNEVNTEKIGSIDTVEAKNKLLGELSSNFSSVKLKPPVLDVEYVDKKNDDDVGGSGGGGDVKNIKNKEEIKEIVTETLKLNVKDEEVVKEDKKNILNRNLDSVILDSNVVKCKVSEEPIEEESRIISPNEPQHSSDYVCSQKTDQFIDKKYVENNITGYTAAEFVEINENGNYNKRSNRNEENNYNNDDDDTSSNNNIIQNNNDNNVEIATSRCSVDKCAIVRKCINNNNNINKINNNNDNNAMTPLDLSSDQSPKVLSIIPGSVRSFVKFYEIQGESNVGLNVSENNGTLKIRDEGSRRKGLPLEFENFNVKNLKDVAVTTQPTEIENEIKYTIVARKEVRKQQYKTEPDQKGNVNQPTDKFDKSSKIVSGETKIPKPRSTSIKLSEKSEDTARREPRIQAGTRSSASYQKTAPNVTLKIPSAATGTVSEKQDGSISDVTRDIVKSGTTKHSVPKPSTTAICNERYTFFCTV